MIHLINELGYKTTTIKKINNTHWEFKLIPFLGYNEWSKQDLDEEFILKEKVLIGKEGIKDIIKGLKKLAIKLPTEKEKVLINWEKNPAELELLIKYKNWNLGGKNDEEYYITWMYANKSLKRFIYHGQSEHLIERLDEIDLQKEGRRGIGVSTTQKNIQKYINDLENEIGEPLTDFEKFKG